MLRKTCQTLLGAAMLFTFFITPGNAADLGSANQEKEPGAWRSGPLGWENNLENAQEAAKSQRKKLFVLFTGSDWCGWCKKLYKEVLVSPEFRAFANKHFVCVYLDSPSAKTRMPKEQRDYNQTISQKIREGKGGGVPCAYILDPADNRILGKISGYSPASNYLSRLSAILTPGAAVEAANPDSDRKNWLSAPSGWYNNLEDAKAAAKGKQKIYVLFTGSDWCGWCIKLHKEVLNKASFKSFAKKEKLLLVYLDMPSKKRMPPEQKAYASRLQSELKAGGGVPSAIILDSEGVVLGKIGGFSPLDKYLSRIRDCIKQSPSAPNSRRNTRFR